MSASKSWEKYPVRGKTVRVRPLGHDECEIEAVMSNLKKDVQTSIVDRVFHMDHASGAEHTKKGNLRCLLLPGDTHSLTGLIEQIADLIVSETESYEQARRSRKRSRAKSRGSRHQRTGAKGYKNKSAAATTVATT